MSSRRSECFRRHRCVFSEIARLFFFVRCSERGDGKDARAPSAKKKKEAAFSLSVCLIYIYRVKEPNEEEEEEEEEEEGGRG